jgi:pyruvate/2-oxoacid:ferredoxin oxidoreductase beta subunit
VARGFSGDKEQLVPLIKGAIRHQGAAFIDVVSPCVAFNNHAGSTKSYDYVREHNEAVSAASTSSTWPRPPRRRRRRARRSTCRSPTAA